jgi:hypothetical protein
MSFDNDLIPIAYNTTGILAQHTTANVADQFARVFKMLGACVV